MENGEGFACFSPEALLADVEHVASRMREALRRDFCAKLAALPAESRQRMHLLLTESKRFPAGARPVIDTLCGGSITYRRLATDPALAEVAEFVDSGAGVESMFEAAGGMRRSYLSLSTVWEQLKDWPDAASEAAGCKSELELLTTFGTLGLPIEVKRRASELAQSTPSPYAIEVSRVCASPGDTASFVAARRAGSAIVPPEGGTTVEDLLVLVDPDAPHASRLAASSKLIGRAYTSLVHCRALHADVGLSHVLALHAHALFSIIQPPSRGVRREDLEAHMQRQYLGRAYQCAECGFGPIDHFACGDLAAHNGQRVGSAVISNACPRCGWFSRFLSSWPKWDGVLPEEALLECEDPSREAVQLTAASAEVALRICYSARAFWDPGDEAEAHQLCRKLAEWDTLTRDDGVEHLVQLLLALVVVDNLPDGTFGPVALTQLLNEACARRAEDEFRRIGSLAGRRRVGAFLGVSYFSAPQPNDTPDEPASEAVRERCPADYRVDRDGFDFKTWVKAAVVPWSHAILFARRLRAAITKREGGWRQLARDMEACPGAYADVIQEMQKPPGRKDSPAALLGVPCKERADSVLAAVAAQAFLHFTPQLRRTRTAGGVLAEPLGDVLEENTLRDLAVELRMLYYYDSLAIKNKRLAELRAHLDRASHVHGLGKKDFWDLWRISTGEDRRRFLMSSNQGFVNRYG